MSNQALAQFLKSFHEKYWSFSSETRINRNQFIVRWLLILICGWVVMYITGILIPSTSMMDIMRLNYGLPIESIWYAISTIISVIIYYIIYRINKVLYIKRYADFNNNGKSPRVLLPISYYGYLVMSIISIMMAYVGRADLIEMSTKIAGGLGENIGLGIVTILAFSSHFMLGAIICIFLMFIISAFTSGTKGANDYGNDPEGNPLI